jgi:hypothetical protein
VFDRPDGSLGAIFQTELAEDIADVGFDRLFADNQVVGDLFV